MLCKNRGIDVITVLPGATVTEFQKTSGYHELKKGRKPENVVNTTLKALGRKWKTIDGFGNKFLSFLAEILPKKLSINLAGNYIKSLGVHNSTIEKKKGD